MTTSGVITEFSVPTADSGLADITSGPDGALWFLQDKVNKVGRITTSGAITEFPVPTVGGFPVGIAAGPDGNLWFTEYSANKIGRLILNPPPPPPLPLACVSPSRLADFNGDAKADMLFRR